MRKPRPEQQQRRFDTPSITDVPLNFEGHNEIIPVLRSLQHIDSEPALRDQILDLIAKDVNQDTRDDVGREGMDYWQILVLVGERLGCNLNYDKLQDLAENHHNLRAIMGVGMWDKKTSFAWQRIRDNVCLLAPETIDAISHLIVGEGHRLDPEAATTARADSFVMETAIHYPTENTLILSKHGVTPTLLTLRFSGQVSAFGRHLGGCKLASVSIRSSLFERTFG